MAAALLRQWRMIAVHLGGLDLDAPSRVAGWRNREVVAHLALQPRLLARFLRRATSSPAEVSLVANLSGTSALAEVIDATARQASDEQPDLGAEIEAVAPALASVDLSATITTLQGPINVADYLRTRCVEAVVHGADLKPPVQPDERALEVAAAALVDVLHSRRPDLVEAAEKLGAALWVDQATGRAPATGVLAEVLPLMT